MSCADQRGMFDTSTVIFLGRLDDPRQLPEDSVISPLCTCNPGDFEGLEVRIVAHPER